APLSGAASRCFHRSEMMPSAEIAGQPLLRCRNRLATAAMASLLLASCAAGPDFVRPDAPPVEEYTLGDLPGSTLDADGQAQFFVRGIHPRPDWWRGFRSPEINDMVDQAMKGNATLSAAEASL